MSDRSLCVIVPCYNEASRLPLDQFARLISGNPDVTICFADDGSTDTTAALLQSFCQSHPHHFFFLPKTENHGKAETIRRAALLLYERNTYAYIGYLDADLSTPLDEMFRLYQVAKEKKETLLVMGTRLRRMGASVTRSSLRHYLGRVFATLASLSLKIPVYDTQCGAKIIRSTQVPVLFDTPFISKWFFDVELLKRLLASPGFELQFSSIVEVPLNRWNAVSGSKIKVTDFLTAPWELYRIHRHYPAPAIDYDDIIAKQSV
ncbi:MAG: glycosyltransferase [Cytophagaceae bacterium]|jgi:glycosyltransferase involved in cell wall biosynthesis|nr:glycosyltransferase [Cytophagaceae bacterium]